MSKLNNGKRQDKERDKRKCIFVSFVMDFLPV